MSKRAQLRRFGLTAVAAAGILTAASDAHATTFPTPYWDGQLPSPPVYAVSSGAADQVIYYASLGSCSGGTWTKYINIENSVAPQYVYQGTMCAGTGPDPAALSNSRSACTSVTAGINYAECLITQG